MGWTSCADVIVLWVFAWVVVRVIPFFSNLLSITGEAFWSFSELIWSIFGCITPTSAPLAPCHQNVGFTLNITAMLISFFHSGSWDIRKCCGFYLTFFLTTHHTPLR